MFFYYFRGNSLFNLVNFHIVLFSHLFVLFFNCTVICLKTFKFNYFFYGKVILNIIHGTLSHSYLETVHIHTHILKVHIYGNALLRNSLCKFLNILCCFIVKHTLGNFPLNRFTEFFKHSIFKCSVCTLCSASGNVLFNAFAKICNGVVILVLSKFVIKFGEFFYLDFVKFYLKHCFLGSKLRGILLGEGYIDIKLVTDFVTDNLFLKAGNELTVTYGEVVFFCFTALKGNSVNKALKVNNRDIALFNCSVADINETSTSFKHMLNFAFNIIFGYFNNRLFCLNALVLFEGNFRFDGNLYCESKTFRHIHSLNVKVFRLVNGSYIRFFVGSTDFIRCK